MVSRRSAFVTIGTVLLAGCVSDDATNDDTADADSDDGSLGSDFDSDLPSLEVVHPEFDLETLPWSQATILETGGDVPVQTDQYHLDPGPTVILAINHEQTELRIDLVDETADRVHEGFVEIEPNGERSDTQAGLGVMPVSGGEFSLEIDAEGQWELVWFQLDTPAAEVIEPPAIAQGTDSALLGPIRSEQGLIAAMEFEPRSNEAGFLTRAYPEHATANRDVELLVDTSGSVSTEIWTEGIGNLWFEIQTVGEWAVHLVGGGGGDSGGGFGQ